MKAGKLTPPEPTTGDTAHLVASAILSPIPGAQELFRRLITPPLEKRQYAWMQEVAAAIETLQSRGGLTLDDLKDNEAFASVVLQATYVAIRNHQAEKRRALAACVIHAGLETHIETDLQLAFVRYVDELSPSHVVLLEALRDRSEQLVSLKSYEEIYQLLRNDLAGSPSRDVFKWMCIDLQGRGLIRISQHVADFDGVYSEDVLVTSTGRHDLPPIILSEVGQQFLIFISSDGSRD